MTQKAYPFVPLPEAFADARGAIQPLVDGSYAALQVISSKKDTVRANHFHKKDSHYLYMVSGSMRYYFRPVGDKGPSKFVDVHAGQMIFTPPMEEHATHFLEDSVFLNITAEKRDQSTYESDIVRVDLFKLPGNPA
jgi:quercetin dioxygenase-like cupin family protein